MDVDSAIVQAARKLGYGEVKSEQSRVIREIVAGNDVFVALPTGYGKSLCYALLPLVFDFVRGRRLASSIVLGVSPLVSLMVDQKEFVGSGEDSTRERIANGQCQLVCQLVCISPEAPLFLSSSASRSSF